GSWFAPLQQREQVLDSWPAPQPEQCLPHDLLDAPPGDVVSLTDLLQSELRVAAQAEAQGENLSSPGGEAGKEAMNLLRERAGEILVISDLRGIWVPEVAQFVRKAEVIGGQGENRSEPLACLRTEVAILVTGRGNANQEIRGFHGTLNPRANPV